MGETEEIIEALRKAKLIKTPDQNEWAELLDSGVKKALHDFEKSCQRKEMLLNLMWTIIGALLGLVLSILINFLL